MLCGTERAWKEQEIVEPPRTPKEKSGTVVTSSVNIQHGYRPIRQLNTLIHFLQLRKPMRFLCTQADQKTLFNVNVTNIRLQSVTLVSEDE